MKNALLVIDVQKNFLNEHTKDIPHKIANFIDNNKFDYILFFKFINDQASNWVRVLKWHGMLKESEIEIANQLQKYANDDNTFIKKAAFSVFRVKKFKECLKFNTISKLYICGMDTHACIYTSAMEAFERDYGVNVIEDLCGSSHGVKFHHDAIESLKRTLSKSSITYSKDI